MCGSDEAKWKRLPWNLSTSKDWRLARRDWRAHSVHQNRRKFRFLAGEASRKLSTLEHVSWLPLADCFQRLPFGLKSTPERYLKRMLNDLEGLEGVRDMHHGWHPRAWKKAKRTRWTTCNSFNKIDQSKNRPKPRQVRIFKETIS